MIAHTNFEKGIVTAMQFAIAAYIIFHIDFLVR